MLMTTRPMNMTVTQLFCGGIADIEHVDIESQIHTGKGVVGIDINTELAHFNHGDLTGTVLPLHHDH